MSNPYDKATVAHPSVLGPTLRFKGELIANENLMIHGHVEGSIKHSSLLTIGKEGKLIANVSAEYIAIDGTVIGDLSGTTSVVVSNGADVKGNINSPVVTLREGAKFNGKIDMTGKQQVQSNATDKDAKDSQAKQDKVSDGADKVDLTNTKSASAA